MHYHYFHLLWLLFEHRHYVHLVRPGLPAACRPTLLTACTKAG
jgi:hypothetical protein